MEPGTFPRPGMTAGVIERLAKKSPRFRHIRAAETGWRGRSTPHCQRPAGRHVDRANGELRTTCIPSRPSGASETGAEPGKHRPDRRRTDRANASWRVTSPQVQGTRPELA